MLSRPSLIFCPIPGVFPFTILHFTNGLEIGVITGDVKHYARKSIAIHRKEYVVAELSHSNLISGVLQDALYVYIPYIENTCDVVDMIETRTLLWGHLEQMLSVMVYLSGNNIAHCDIKPENFIVQSNGTVKLVDFGGCSKDICEINKGVIIEATPGYNAPEIFNRNKTVDPYKADVFSMGILMYMCIIGKHPVGIPSVQSKNWMDGHDIDKIIDDIVVLNPTNQPTGLLDDTMTIIKSMVKPDAKDRMPISIVSGHINEIIHKYGVTDTVI